jgi:segregation and condensation protein B
MEEKVDKATLEQLTKAVTALLFASDKPLSLTSIVDIFESAQAQDETYAYEIKDIEAALSTIQDSVLPPLGLVLGKAAGGFRILTSVEFAPLIGHLFPTKKTRFSPAAMETLAIIAYRQPCTRSDVESVRGVDCGGMLRNLLERSLIRIIGQRDEPGRPLIYATSDEFLKVFSLDSLAELPPLRQIEKLSDETNFRAELLAEIDSVSADEDGAKPNDGQLSLDASLMQSNSQTED